MAKVNEIHIEKLVDTVAKTLVEAFENLTIEDVNMYQIGYNKAIDEFAEKLVEVSEFYSPGGYMLPIIKVRMIARQLKAGAADE